MQAETVDTVRSCCSSVYPFKDSDERVNLVRISQFEVLSRREVQTQKTLKGSHTTEYGCISYLNLIISTKDASEMPLLPKPTDQLLNPEHLCTASCCRSGLGRKLWPHMFGMLRPSCGVVMARYLCGPKIDESIIRATWHHMHV